MADNRDIPAFQVRVDNNVPEASADTPYPAYNEDFDMSPMLRDVGSATLAAVIMEAAAFTSEIANVLGCDDTQLGLVIHTINKHKHALSGLLSELDAYNV
jgi:hypothetical protein